MQYRAFIFDFLAGHAVQMLDWAQRTRAALDAWPALGDAQRRAAALALVELRLGDVRAAPGDRP